MEPPFVMSKYASIIDLLKDKASYYESLIRFFAANVDNEKLDDVGFRAVVRNSISQYDFPNPPEAKE